MTKHLMTTSSADQPAADEQPDVKVLEGLTPGPAVPLRHPWRWVACAIVVVLLAWFGRLMVTNRNFQWPVVAKYLFNAEILARVEAAP